MKVTIHLEREDYDAMRDVILEALNLETDISDATIKSIWDRLSNDVKHTVVEWGFNNMVFRDKLYEWLKENSESIKISDGKAD